MRRYSLLSALLLAVIFVFQGCRGPEGLPGPQGPEGPRGADGAELLPAVIELQPVSFNAANEYQVYFDLPDDLAGHEADVVLVYLLYNTETINGTTVDVWRALPLVEPAGTGFFQYGFDYTMFDVRLFLNGTVNLSTIDNSWTQNQVFRVVVLPTERLARKADIDLTNYEEVVKAYGIDESKIKTVSPK